jgi:hypothetical protein
VLLTLRYEPWFDPGGVDVRNRRRLMARKRVDLRTLPVWLQYFISLTVVVLVVTAAWIAGSDRPTPAWITHYVVPTLGWIYLVLFVFLIIRWFARRLKP